MGECKRVREQRRRRRSTANSQSLAVVVPLSGRTVLCFKEILWRAVS